MWKKIIFQTFFLSLSILFIIPSLFKETCISREKAATRLENISLARSGSESPSQISFNMSIKKGFYKAEGLNVEIVTMKSSVMSGAIVGGGIDFSGGAGNTLRAGVAGMPAKLIFVGATRRPTYVVAKPGIKSLKDLKGKTVGTGGGSEDMAFKIVFKEDSGLDPDKDVVLINIGPQVKIPSLISGAVDAIFASIEDMMFLKKRGYNELVRVSDRAGALSQGLGTNEKKLKERRDQVKRMVKATLKGHQFVLDKEKSEEVIAFMVKEWGFVRDEAKISLAEHLKYFTKRGTISDDILLDAIEQMKALGINLKKGLNPSELVDFSFAEESAKELGLK